MYSHYKCYEYKELKAEWETAIEKGIKRSCPNCGIGGHKDDACTHMTCDNCHTAWCYLCGVSDDKLDKKDPSGNIYSHNEDWDSNEKRCPMYLTEVFQVDERWSKDDDQECKDFLHKLLIYTNIKEYIEKHGRAKYNELCEVFPTCGQHGYNIEEALNTDLTLIQR